MEQVMNRECGNCTVCCTVTRVPELNKAEGVTCSFVCGTSSGCTGCSIYKDRPQSCRDFACAWLHGDMPSWMKPEKSHVMLERIPDAPVVMALPEPGYESTWRTPEVVKALKEQYQDKGIAVIASDKLALLPEGMSGEKVWRHVMSRARETGVIR